MSHKTLWAFLLTSAGLFFDPVQLDGLAHLALVQVAYTALFLGAAWLRFTRGDVLS